MSWDDNDCVFSAFGVASPVEAELVVGVGVEVDESAVPPELAVPSELADEVAPESDDEPEFDDELGAGDELGAEEDDDELPPAPELD